MLSPIYHTRRIERPPGLPGYCPAVWCAVCGTAANAKHPHVSCVVEDCPNVCHQRCLLEDSEYNCEHTEDLRNRNGKPLSVTFSIEGQPNLPTTTEVLDSFTVDEDRQISTESSPDAVNVIEIADDENLDHLTSNELKSYIGRLKSDLQTTKSKLSNLESVITGLPEKRDILVQALSIVDTLIATQSCQAVQSRTIACSAIPSRIDSDWENKLTESKETSLWWNSSFAKTCVSGLKFMIVSTLTGFVVILGSTLADPKKIDFKDGYCIKVDDTWSVAAAIGT